MPRWSRNSLEIYYYPAQFGGILMGQPDLESRFSSEPIEFEFVDLRTGRFTNFDATADGQGFLVIARATGTDDVADAEPATPRINVILNWFEELKRLVPTGR